MEKIPVGKSIGGAYGFFFGRCLTILCLSWLPAVIYAGARLALVDYSAPLMAQALNGHHPPAEMHLVHLAFFLFSLLMVAVIALPLNREALGLGGERVLAHFVIGGRELRLFAAFVRFEIVFIALIAALVLAIIGVHLGANAAAAHWPILAQYNAPNIVHLAAIVLVVLLVLFAALRLSFLIGPIAAAEDKASLARAWSLSAGNFWRILAIFLATMVPLLIVLCGADYAVMGPSLHMAFAHPDFQSMFATMIQHAPALAAISVVGLVIACALSAGASAAAYRALVPPPEPEEPAYAEPAQTHAHVEPVAEYVAEPQAEHAVEPEAQAIAEAPAEEPAPHVAEVMVVQETLAAHPADEHQTEPLHEAAAPAEEALPEQTYSAEEMQPLTLQDELPAAEGEAAHIPAPDAAAEPEAHPQ